MFKTIDPLAAREAADTADNVVLLDVRTEEEFAEGHPPGAYNIPIYLLTPDGQMTPNQEFPKLVQHHLEGDMQIIAVCKSGQRSAQAAEVMVNMGFADVANLIGGFHGHTGFMGQQGAPGWIGCGLPVANEAEPGRSYAALKLA